MTQNSKIEDKESMNLLLSDVQGMLKDSILMGEPGTRVERLQMDSRNVQSGDLFLALKGERFDAHDFLGDISKVPGVSAIIQNDAKDTALKHSLSALGVKDTKQALGELAKAWRIKHPIPLIAVSGSNGKTTVTQMIASILKVHAGDNAFATQGNLNNDIGLPQTILRMRDHHVCAVVELGMNHPGEIEYLASIAQPNVGLVNNAQREHQEFMNTVEAVAVENGQVIHSLASTGTAVFPADDEFTQLWLKMCGDRPYLTFTDKESSAVGFKNSQVKINRANVSLINSSFIDGAWSLKVDTPVGVLNAQLHIAGQHNVKNALAAITCCLAINISLAEIREGLAQFQAVKGRSRSLKLSFNNETQEGPNQNVLNKTALDLIDDTYNANPDSVIAAINVLAQMNAPALLILGDMGEVGSEGPSYHEEVGEYAAKCGISSMYGLGELSKYAVEAFNKNLAPENKKQQRACHYVSMESLISNLNLVPHQFKSVLIKGSRFMKMERSVQALEALQTQTLNINDLQLSAQLKESTCC